jgi:hypothetical protein
MHTGFLQDKYLPDSDVRHIESIVIHVPAEQVWPLLESSDCRKSWVIRWLFRIRGIPMRRHLSLRSLEKSSFNFLETRPPRSFIIGIVGQFWTPTGKLLNINADEFIAFANTQYAKGTWSFEIVDIDRDSVRLVTETRVKCYSNSTRRKFKIYWFVIRPFSALIRREMLKIIRRNAET